MTDSANISNQIADKEKELSEALTAYYTVEQEKLLLQRDILERQVKKKDLEMTLSKASHNIRQLNIELKLLKSEFWSCKNQGL